MRDMLRGSLRLSLQALNPLDRLAAAWPVACGTALALHGEVEALDEAGVLQVRVESAAWMPPFLAARATLTSEVAKIAGVPVSEIHFYLKPKTQERAAVALAEPPHTPGEKY